MISIFYFLFFYYPNGINRWTNKQTYYGCALSTCFRTDKQLRSSSNYSKNAEIKRYRERERDGGKTEDVAIVSALI